MVLLCWQGHRRELLHCALTPVESEILNAMLRYVSLHAALTVREVSLCWQCFCSATVSQQLMISFHASHLLQLVTRASLPSEAAGVAVARAAALPTRLGSSGAGKTFLEALFAMALNIGGVPLGNDDSSSAALGALRLAQSASDVMVAGLLMSRRAVAQVGLSMSTCQSKYQSRSLAPPSILHRQSKSTTPTHS